MGPGGTWLIDMEGDGPEAEASIREFFGGDPPPTLGWASTRGRHRLFVVDQAFVDALAKAEGKPSGSGTYHPDAFPDLEFRVGGTKPDGTVKALQSVAPPSMGSDGTPRRWIGPVAVATMPGAVAGRLDALAASREAAPVPRRPEPAWTPPVVRADGYARAALVAECEAVAMTLNGGRNDRLNKASHALGTLIAAGALDEREAVAGLEAAAGQAGLGDHETTMTIRSGIEAGKASPRDLSNVGTSRPSFAPSPPAPPPVDSWNDPNPVRAELPPVAPMTPNMIPASLRPWLIDMSERVRCPLDYPTAAAVVGLPIVVGRAVMIRPMARDDWTVCPNLWGCLVGRPSMLKTPALTAAIKPLGRLEAEAREAHGRAMIAFGEESAIDAAMAAAAKKELEAAARKKAPRDVLAAMAERATAAESRPKPVRRRYTTSDPTVEKLGELLRDNPDGIGIKRDELAGWFRSFDKPGREGDREFMLKGGTGRGSRSLPTG